MTVPASLCLDPEPVIDGHVVLACTPLFDEEQVDAAFRLDRSGIVAAVKLTFPPISVNWPYREHQALEILTVACDGRFTLDGLLSRSDIPDDTIAGKLLTAAAMEAAQ